MAKIKVQPREPYEHPDLPGKWSIRKITGRERAQILDASAKCRNTGEGALSEGEKDRIWAATLTAMFLGNESGDRIFDDASINEASDLPYLIQEDVNGKGLTLNGLKPDSVEDEKKT